jgi:hypothetical protein
MPGFDVFVAAEGKCGGHLYGGFPEPPLGESEAICPEQIEEVAGQARLNGFCWISVDPNEQRPWRYREALAQASDWRHGQFSIMKRHASLRIMLPRPVYTGDALHRDLSSARMQPGNIHAGHERHA